MTQIFSGAGAIIQYSLKGEDTKNIVNIFYRK